MLDWVRGVHETSQWTTSVCTGSLVLAAAGVLEGREATTHWSAATSSSGSARPTSSSGSSSTARSSWRAGVSAGIDMALTLAAQIAGDDIAQAIQLYIEYDPQPPFDSGSPSKAPASVMALAARAGAKEQIR